MRFKEMNTPNKLTTIRIICVPVVILLFLLYVLHIQFGWKTDFDLLNGNAQLTITQILIFVLFTFASITDFVDGYLARKNNQVTTFGKFLDPLADKILVLAAMVMLVEMAKLPAWIQIIVLAREFIVSGYRLVAVEKGGQVIAASKWGKIKTVTQMIAIILAFLDLNAFGDCFGGMLQGGDAILNFAVTIMMLVQTVATIFSGVDYLKGAKKLIMS